MCRCRSATSPAIACRHGDLGFICTSAALEPEPLSRLVLRPGHECRAESAAVGFQARDRRRHRRCWPLVVAEQNATDADRAARTACSILAAGTAVIFAGVHQQQGSGLPAACAASAFRSRRDSRSAKPRVLLADALVGAVALALLGAVRPGWRRVLREVVLEPRARPSSCRSKSPPRRCGRSCPPAPNICTRRRILDAVSRRRRARRSIRMRRRSRSSALGSSRSPALPTTSRFFSSSTNCNGSRSSRRHVSARHRRGSATGCVHRGRTACSTAIALGNRARHARAVSLCGAARRRRRRTARIVGGATEYEVGETCCGRRPPISRTGRDTRIRGATRRRRRHGSRSPATALRIAGSGWPGIVRCSTAKPESGISCATDDAATRDGDLLYLGTWREPQMQSLAGSSSSGIPAPLIPQPWFPATVRSSRLGPRFECSIYSEAPRTDVPDLVARHLPSAPAADGGAVRQS